MAVDWPPELWEFPPHLLTLEFLTPEQILAVVEFADRVEVRHILTEYTLGVNEFLSPMFFETLLATGSVLELDCALDGSKKLFEPGSLSEYDVVFLEKVEHEFMEKVARFSSAALVNCRSGWSEPLAALAALHSLKHRQKLPGEVFLSGGSSPRRRSLLKLCAALEIETWIEPCSGIDKLIVKQLRKRGAKIKYDRQNNQPECPEFPAPAQCRESWQKILRIIAFIYTNRSTPKLSPHREGGKFSQ
ncbi:MAG: hypothetical protein ACLFN5_03130 [bacterium]